MKTIVVGAGSAGGVLAARLSEDEAHDVILVEAGPDFPDVQTAPWGLKDGLTPQLTEWDWGYEARTSLGSDERRIAYPRGKVVGGSSSVNGATAQRGVPQDYDQWAALGNDLWSWHHVLPYFMRLEHDLDFSDDYHGREGPVPILRLPDDEAPEVLQAFAAACVARGFPVCRDHNAPDATGIGPLPRNQLGQVRGSSLFTYLAGARARGNLTVRANAVVTRVLLDAHRACGVEVATEAGVAELLADRVVLCAGAINTPLILMYSGIGPREVLAERGLPGTVELPSVGRNLMDHPAVPLVGVLTEELDVRRHGFRFAVRWSSAPGQFNDLMIAAGVLRRESLNAGVVVERHEAAIFSALVAKPTSRGYVVPGAAEPFSNPEIHLRLLATPEDVIRQRQAVRLAFEVAADEHVRRYLGDFSLDGSAMDDRALDEWIVENVRTGYHATGTCRMGPEADPLAVVDQRLRVAGVDGLWVADASVMPVIPTGYTNLACFMIGERAAEWLRDGAAQAGGRASVATAEANPHLTEDEVARLHDEGYVVLPGSLTREQLDRMTGRLDDPGKLGSLCDHAAFDVCRTHPRVTAAVEVLLGDSLELVAMHPRRRSRGEGHEALHDDWPEPAYDGRYRICNVMWMLDEFSEANGAPLIIPGSHLAGRTAEAGGGVRATGPAGAALVFNGHVRHGGVANDTEASRRYVTMVFHRAADAG